TRRDQCGELMANKMMISGSVPLLLRCLLSLVVLLGWEHRVAAAQIEKLLAFATADSVRVETVVQSETAAQDVEIMARLIHIKTGQVFWRGPLGKINLQTGAPGAVTQTISQLRPE